MFRLIFELGKAVMNWVVSICNKGPCYYAGPFPNGITINTRITFLIDQAYAPNTYTGSSYKSNEAAIYRKLIL